MFNKDKIWELKNAGLIIDAIYCLKLTGNANCSSSELETTLEMIYEPPDFVDPDDHEFWENADEEERADYVRTRAWDWMAVGSTKKGGFIIVADTIEELLQKIEGEVGIPPVTS